MLEESAKDAEATGVRAHIYALNPPEKAIAPVAPFLRDAELAKHLAIFIREKIQPLVRIGEHGGDAAAQRGVIECLAFGFFGEAAVVFDDELQIARLRWT